MSRQNGPLVLSVINLKGGVGKSTIATLLAKHAYYVRQKDVLAIDVDPQANLSQALMGNINYAGFIDSGEGSIVELFSGYLPPSRNRYGTGALNPDDITKTIDEDPEANESLQLIPSRFDFSDNLIQSIKPDPTALANFLAREFQHKDLIIIDCAPTESVITHAAYHASGLILVPVKPEYFATIGFPLLQESLTDFRRHNRAHIIDVAGVVVNNGFYDGGNDGGPEKREAMNDIYIEAQKNGWHIFKNEIPFSRGFPKIMRGNNSYSGNAADFPLFANEFFNRIGL